ncbi:MAG: NAD(P)/FAD-dependent oxidoreductase [Burkholderiaceae bacterium]
MERVDCVVVGAGVVGLAVARELARRGREVLVLERAHAIGTETSSRNSEVIHAGIYYPRHLLKRRLCVEGKALLYAFCAEYGVAHRRCGKLIVATSEAQTPQLAALARQAEANGVGDLRFLAPAEVARLEPEVRCMGALLSPSSGIVDSHGLMLALQGDAERHGALIALATPVAGGAVRDDGLVLRTGGAAPTTLLARSVINCAGLGAQRLALAIDGVPAATVPPLHLAKGNYYTLAGRNPFSRLVYPLPEPGGLGVHVTIDLGARARFGPDVEWIDEIDYTVDPRRADAFYAAVRKYWPALADGALAPGYAGIRPKVERPGGSNTDFVIHGAEMHGVRGLVNLYGIESPGLTASLALARYVADLV